MNFEIIAGVCQMFMLYAAPPNLNCPNVIGWSRYPGEPVYASIYNDDSVLYICNRNDLIGTFELINIDKTHVRVRLSPNLYVCNQEVS